MFEDLRTNNDVVAWCDKAVWDPVNHQVRLLASAHNGDHRYFQYSESNNAFSILPDPPWDTAGAGALWIGHGYQHNAMDPTTGDHYYARFGNSAVQRLTRATGVWDTLPVGRTTTGAAGTCAIEWLPTIGTQGGLVCLVYDTVSIWNKATQVWTVVGNVTPRGEHPVAWRSAPQNLVIVGGGNAGGQMWSVNASGTVTARATCPNNLGFHVNAGLSSVCPVSGDVISINGDNSAYKYSHATNAWTALSLSGAPSFGPAGTMGPGARHFGVPIPTYGVIMVFFGNSSEIWIYKHA